MRRLALLAIVCGTGRVEADPAIVLDRCATLDRAALRAAIDRELAASPRDDRRDELTLVVRCPDAVTAHVSIERKTSTLPLARSLDLGEVPQDLRIKLLAVAAVELIEVATMPRKSERRDGAATGRSDPPAGAKQSPPPAAQPSPPPAAALGPDDKPLGSPTVPRTPAPPPAAALGPDDKPLGSSTAQRTPALGPDGKPLGPSTAQRASAAGALGPDGRPLGSPAAPRASAPPPAGALGPDSKLLAAHPMPAATDRTATDGGASEQRRSIPGGRVAAASALRGGEATASIEHPRGPAFAIVPRLGVRVYPSRAIPLGHLAIDVELRWLTLGVAGSLGTASDTLGTLTPYLVTATASSRWWCAGRIDRACVRARGELGVAGVAARGANQEIVANDARAPYGQLGVALEAAHSFGALAAVVGVDAAWAEGLVATVQDRAPVRLDGAAITAVVGLRWSR